MLFQKLIILLSKKCIVMMSALPVPVSPDCPSIVWRQSLSGLWCPTFGPPTRLCFITDIHVAAIPDETDECMYKDGAL